MLQFLFNLRAIQKIVKIEAEYLLSLYDTMILPGAEPLPKTQPEEVAPKKQISLLVCRELNVEEKAFVAKIMGSIQKTPEDYFIYEVSDDESLENWPNGEPELFLLMDHFGFYKEKYKEIKKGSSTLISTDALSEIMNSKDKKLELWNCLKKFYNI